MTFTPNESKKIIDAIYADIGKILKLKNKNGLLQKIEEQIALVKAVQEKTVKKKKKKTSKKRKLNDETSSTGTVPVEDVPVDDLPTEDSPSD